MLQLFATADPITAMERTQGVLNKDLSTGIIAVLLVLVVGEFLVFTLWIRSLQRQLLTFAQQSVQSMEKTSHALAALAAEMRPRRRTPIADPQLTKAGGT